MNESCQWDMSHVNEPYHTWTSDITCAKCPTPRCCMSHVSYPWVMSHINEACHIWISQIIYEWVMSQVNTPLRIWIGYVSDELAILHIITSYLNESRDMWYGAFYIWIHIWIAVWCSVGNTLQHAATHCNTLQHTATNCNTLQHIYEFICHVICPVLDIYEFIYVMNLFI